MIQKLKTLILTAGSLLAIGAPAVISGTAYADTPDTQQSITKNLCNGSNLNFDTSAKSTCDTNSSTKQANKLVSDIINILSLVVGAVAVIMLIIAGFRYTASGGKDDAVKGAKNTIVYALIGLVVVALAQLVVHFVLNKVTDAANG